MSQSRHTGDDISILCRVKQEARLEALRKARIQSVRDWTLDAVLANDEGKTSTPKRRTSTPIVKDSKPPVIHRHFQNVDESHLLTIKELRKIFSPAKNKGN